MLDFLVSKTGKITSLQRDKYKKIPMQLEVFRACYDFLYYFVLNHENNTNELTEKKYVKLFTYHLNFPELKKHALTLLTVLIRNNDAANVLI